MWCTMTFYITKKKERLPSLFGFQLIIYVVWWKYYLFRLFKSTKNSNLQKASNCRRASMESILIEKVYEKTSKKHNLGSFVDLFTQLYNNFNPLNCARGNLLLKVMAKYSSVQWKKECSVCLSDAINNTV